MANVHRIGEYANPNAGGGYNQMPGGDNPYQLVLDNKIPFLYVPDNTVLPLDESIPYTIKLTFCPSLKLLSLTNFLALVLIGMFITTCVMGINTNGTSILQIQASVLIEMGANVPYNVYNGQVYRLITAAFLHANLTHILSNLFSMYFLLSRLEACFNVAYLVGLYLISAVCGNILSVLTSKLPNQISVGASTAILGMLGALVAYLIINWATLGKLGPLRCQLTCIVGMLMFFSLFFSVVKTNSTVDVYGHIGGFVGGLFGAMLILPPIDPRTSLTAKIVAGTVLIAYLLTTFLVFYLAKYN